MIHRRLHEVTPLTHPPSYTKPPRNQMVRINLLSEGGVYLLTLPVSV